MFFSSIAVNDVDSENPKTIQSILCEQDFFRPNDTQIKPSKDKPNNT